MLATNKAKRHAIEELFESTTYSNADFYVLLVGSIVIAAFAIFDDSIPSLIASMIIAPLATPILALGLGIATRKWRMIGRALGLLLVSCLISLVLAVVLTMLLGDNQTVDRFSFTGNHTDSFIVALVSGAIATYGLLRPKVASAITGVAIAVSLMPPLVATGIGLAPGGATATGALTLFLLNVFGILIASVLVFCWFRMSGVGIDVATSDAQLKSTPAS